MKASDYETTRQFQRYSNWLAISLLLVYLVITVLTTPWPLRVLVIFATAVVYVQWLRTVRKLFG